MSFLDRLLGTGQSERQADAPVAPRAPRTDDEIAVERYRYLLRTAPPETIEQVHREAFAKLTDAQRALIYEELSKGAQTGERPLSSEPATLARSATRAEFRQPGTMERVLGGGANGGSGSGFASTLGASLLGSVAGYVIGSALVSAFLPWDGWGSSADGSDAGNADSSGADSFSTDTSSGDTSGTDASAADWGGESSGFDSGGDLGDFGF